MVIEFASPVSLEQITLDALKGRMSIHHFLKSAKPSDIFCIKSTPQVEPLNRKLNPALVIPDWLDIGALDPNAIDLEMLRDAFDLGNHSITSDANADTLDDAQDECGQQEQCRQRDDCFLFHVVHKYPSKILDSGLASTDIVISQLTTNSFDRDTGKAMGTYEKTISHGDVLSLGELQGCLGMLHHTHRMSTHYGSQLPVEGCSVEEASNALDALYNASALEGAENPRQLNIDNQTDSRKEALERLAVEGYVAKLSDTGDVSSWHLTEAGAELVDTSLWLQLGPLVPRLRDVPPEEMTELELLGVLDRRRWRGRVWYKQSCHRTHLGPAPPPVITATGEPKEWWVHDGGVQLDRRCCFGDAAAAAKCARVSNLVIHCVRAGCMEMKVFTSKGPSGSCTASPCKRCGETPHPSHHEPNEPSISRALISCLARSRRSSASGTHGKKRSPMAASTSSR